MLNLLRSPVVCIGLLTATGWAIAPRLMAQPFSVPIQISYSKLDVNAIDLYYSDSVETGDSSDLQEAVDSDTASEESSDEPTSLQ